VTSALQPVIRLIRSESNVREGFEEDTLLITLDLDIRVRLFTLAATYGVTDTSMWVSWSLL